MHFAETRHRSHHVSRMSLETSCQLTNHVMGPHNTRVPPRYEVLDRLVQGLSGLFLALRRRPVVRYQRSSEQARRLAESLYSLTYKQQVGSRGFCMAYTGQLRATSETTALC